MKSVEDVAHESMNKGITLQANHYDERHKTIDVEMGNLILLNTVNLRLKGMSGKLRKKVIGPFGVTERIGAPSYILRRPQEWSYTIFVHILLLNKFHESKYGQEPKILDVNELEPTDETIYKV